MTKPSQGTLRDEAFFPKIVVIEIVIFTNKSDKTANKINLHLKILQSENPAPITQQCTYTKQNWAKCVIKSDTTKRKKTVSEDLNSPLLTERTIRKSV